MVDKYFIPGLPFLMDKMNVDTKALVPCKDESIVEISSPEEKNAFLKCIKQIDFVNDKEIYEFFKENIPDVKPYFEIMPISHDAIRDALVHIFDDLPDNVFESDNILVGLKKLFNHVIRKNEIEFIAINMENGELSYDENYPYKKMQDFYYSMLKLGYNMDTYYDFFCRTQSVLRRIFVKEILFSDGKIDKKKQDLLNRVFNITGQNLEDFRYRLESARTQIKNHRRTIKRTGIKLLPKYNAMEKEVLDKIENTLKDIDIRIKDSHGKKKELAAEVRKRHGLISFETAKKILREIKWFRPFIKD